MDAGHAPYGGLGFTIIITRSFVFERLRKLPRNVSPLVTKGPHDPIRFALLATSCLLREIEAATATISAWTFDYEAQELT